MQTKTEAPKHKFLLLLSLIYFAAICVSYIVGYKLVKIGPILDTAAIFIFPLTFTLSDIIAEIYGYKVARQLIWASILAGFVFCLALVLLVKLPSPPAWHKEADYLVVLSPILHIYLAISAGLACGVFVNIICITRWKILCKGKFFWLRSLGSSAIGESIFGVIAASIAFFGKIPLSYLLHIIITGIIIKIVYNLIIITPASLLVVILKRVEKTPPSYVYKNPFKRMNE